MIKYLLIILGVVLALTSNIYAEGKAEWEYYGFGGPKHWGELCEEFKMCSEGKNQSPINLTGFIEAELSPIEVKYAAGTLEILNNGHTIRINYAAGSTITIDGREYELKQFHFRVPSENKIEDKSFPMEAQLIHADSTGSLAVVAVMLERDAANALITELWKTMPKHAGDVHKLQTKLDVSGLLPESLEYYRFNGSLTTPPCAEGVMWIVMKEPVSVSKKQIDKFSLTIRHPNNRPLQPVNSRPVLK